MRIPEENELLLVGCGILEIFFIVVFGILGFGIWNPAQGIRNPTTDWSSESIFH